MPYIYFKISYDNLLSRHQNIILLYKYSSASILQVEIDVDHVDVHTNKQTSKQNNRETEVSLETNHRYLLIIWWYIKIVCLLVCELKILNKIFNVVLFCHKEPRIFVFIVMQDLSNLESGESYFSYQQNCKTLQIKTSYGP